ncbi:hypothetical protein B0H63DRAFT_404700 [Podospora didyma]|uniref:Uncharacterized protein n=1 Tax=Podospora didyma TaxID=330526 RepID=A0AAE0K1N6_9PEZI|nr:hypothetical protein B0H63DRAFT_404700 [Podospora didyma]
MSLRLAPYNDAMRLGQGFNSYTHELCINGAVEVDQRIVVSYSARYIEKLSDIVEAMNLSYSSAIKKGTIEISGNSTTVDENTFKLSDMNVVVSVRVVNQTIAIEEQSTFKPLNDEGATAARFNEVYGDSYISGFIEGGDFSGIMSIKVVDRSNITNVVNSIKASLVSSAKPEAEDFVLGPTTGEGLMSSALGSALKNTQTTISINWMGGGQIKEPTQSWDIDSMYAAAAAFPASVAQCPQRTWAILTPYKANRSFVNWSMGSPIKTLQYDLISSFTAELFDRFMDYKLLLKRAQNILSNRKSYRQRIGVPNAIGTDVSTLLCLRAALRNEQTKIVEAIEVLGKDPTVLRRQAAWTNGHRSEVVRRIVDKALGSSKDWQPIAADEVAQQTELPLESPPANSSTSPAPPNNTTIPAFDAQQTFNFDTLIAPEVWEDLLPVCIPHPCHPIYALTAPPPDSSSGPASMVVVSQSYTDMERDLKAAKESSTAAEAQLEESRAALAALRAEYSALDVNSEYLQFKSATAAQVSTLERQLADASARAASAQEELLREQNVRQDVQRQVDNERNLKTQLEGRIQKFKDALVGFKVHLSMNGIPMDWPFFQNFKITEFVFAANELVYLDRNHL